MIWQRRAAVIISAVTWLGLAACGSTDPQAPGPHEVPLLLSRDTAQTKLSAPDTVDAGRPFTVTFNSLEGGCRAGTRISVAVTDAAAEVRGYDRLSGDAICSTLLITMPQSTTVTFVDRGVATIRVFGDAWEGDLATPTEIDKTVFVR